MKIIKIIVKIVTILIAVPISLYVCELAFFPKTVVDFQTNQNEFEILDVSSEL